MEEIKPLVHAAECIEVIDLTTRGLVAAFGGTTSEAERERESPGIEGLSRSRSASLVVSPA